MGDGSDGTATGEQEDRGELARRAHRARIHARSVPVHVLARVALLLTALLGARTAAAQCPMLLSVAGANVTLTADHVCQAGYVGDAIRVTADAVTLDGGGFAVVLESSGNGVRVSPGRSDVTVRGVVVAPAAGAVNGISIGTGTTRTVVEDCVLSGLTYGVATTGGGQVDLVLRDLDVSNALVGGMKLSGTDGGFVLEGNTFDGSVRGLRLSSAVGPWTLGGTNSFVGVGLGTSDKVVELVGTTDVTVSGLVVGPSPGVALTLNRTSGTVVTGSVLSGSYRGIVTSGTTDNAGVVITGTDVSASTQYGMYLDSVTNALDVTDNRFDGSTVGLRVQDLIGPWSLGAGNTFAGVGASLTNPAVYLYRTTAVTIAGQDLSDTRGVGIGVFLDSTIGTTVTDNDVSGRWRGVSTRAAPAINTDLALIGNDASGSADYAMGLDGVDGGLVISGNVFDGSVRGVDIEDVAFPPGWTFDPSNSFVGVGTLEDASALRFADVSNVTVAGLDLSATTGLGYGLRIVGGADVVVRDNDLSGRRFGLFVDPSTTNTGFTIEDNDVSDASLWGMWLEGFDATLVLQRNDFAGDEGALRLASVTGPVVVDLSTSDLTDVGGASGLRAIKVADSTDVTVRGVTLALNGTTTGLRVERSTNVSAEDFFVCDADYGVFLEDAQDASVTGSVFGGCDVNGVRIDALTDGTLVDATFGGNGTDVRDEGTNTTVVANPPLSDADADGNPDVCDICPNDPLDDADGDGVCDTVDLCAGDDLAGDQDADGWCADLDCDDGEPTTFPNAPETCDGADDDCDGLADDGGPFRDDDGDTCGDCAVGPFDPANDGPDADGDGQCDAGDPDDDDDTVADPDDVDPIDPTRCQDLDLDTCDDCSQSIPPSTGQDGPDADGDGVCDATDFGDDDVVLTPGQAPWTPGGIGAPSVIFDRAAGQFVMIYETRSGSDPACPGGVWSLGLATSPDGVTWTDSGGPLLTPAAGTYWSCVVAHPAIVQHGGPGAYVTTVFFKAQQGGGVYSGIGRILLTWNGSAYVYSGPDPTPVLSIAQNFGYPKVAWDESLGQYRLTFTQLPDLYTTYGTGTSLQPPTGPVLQPGFATWAQDEVFNPAFGCEGGDYVGFFGGRDLSGALVTSQAHGRRLSTDFATWGPGPGPIMSTPGDPELRHWDVVGVGESDWLLYYDIVVGGRNEVHLTVTDPGWQVADVRDKVCGAL